MKVLGFLFTIFTAAAAPSEFATLPNAFVGGPKDPKTVQVSVVDEAQANALFKKFLSNKDIPFGYPLSGCDARALAMAKMAEKDGITVGKIYVVGQLNAKTRFSLYPKATFDWHVAPVIYVQQKSGPPKIMVLDPTLFERPASEDELKTALSATIDSLPAPKITQVYYGSKYQYGTQNSGEPFKHAWDAQDTAKMQTEFRKFSGLQDESKGPIKRNDWDINGEPGPRSWQEDERSGAR